MKTFALIALLTLCAIAVHGYHAGLEDQAIYLPAIKLDLNPQLYPHDAELFLAQTHPTLFDEAVALSTRALHLPLEWILLLWQIASIGAILWGCARLLRRCFQDEAAVWGGMALLTALLTLPVAGTWLYIVDQYLHPRAPATAFILFFLGDILDRKYIRAGLWLIPAALMHIQMTTYGLMLGVFLLLPQRWLRSPTQRASAGLAILAFPLKTLFQPASPAWLEAARTRSSHYLLRWEWYEWIGVFAPLLLLAWFARIGERKRLPKMADLSRRVLFFGVFILVASAVLTIPPPLERLVPYQPMRGFHLVYVFLLLFGGGLLGQLVLKRQAWRWVALLLPICIIMFCVQRQIVSGGAHIEWPGAAPRSPWLQAFSWIKHNTPNDAYFALDPYYVEKDGEDFHGFRALAERSMMADYVKDSGVVLLFPALAERWQREVRARVGWRNFQREDFRRLRRDFGVNWIVVENGHPVTEGFSCPYENRAVRVCRIDDL